jgi:hypothetical protein
MQETFNVQPQHVYKKDSTKYAVKAYHSDDSQAKLLSEARHKRMIKIIVEEIK